MAVECPECGEDDTASFAAKMLSYDIVRLDENGEPTTQVLDTQPTNKVVSYQCETCGEIFVRRNFR